MPPRKKKRKAKTPKTTQRQSQRQSVVVNIGSRSSPRKSSGRGNLPPPSHAHNLAPTFITAPQVDYTPLLAMMQHHSRPIVEQAPMPVQNPVTPLSSISTQTNIDARTAQQLAGEAALRRAGKTAGNFQRQPSQADERFALDQPKKEETPSVSAEISAPQVAIAQPVSVAEPVRQADPYYTKRLIEDEGVSGGGASSTPRTPQRQKQQAKAKTDIKDVIDRKLKSGEQLTQQEMKVAMMPSTQIGKGRAKKLVAGGYPQFESLL